MFTDSSVNISILSESQYGDWDSFSAKASGASPYSSSQYLSILCTAAGGTFRIVGAFIAGRLVGGVALYESKSLYGNCANPRLLLYYHGILLSREIGSSTQIEVLCALAGTLSTMGYARVTLANLNDIQDVRPFLRAGWRSWPSYTYVMPLTKDVPAHTLFDKNLRRLARRAEDAGVVVTQDDDFDSFFALHSEIHERKGAPLYLDRQSFRRYITGLLASGLGRLYHARTSSGPACATQLVLTGAQSQSHTICAGSAKDSLKLGVTPFLRARVFDSLAMLGYQGNDLTDAALGPVTHFKSHLGATLVQNINVEKVFSPVLRARLAFKQVFGR
jgi:hypothetical protein